MKLFEQEIEAKRKEFEEMPKEDRKKDKFDEKDCYIQVREFCNEIEPLRRDKRGEVLPPEKKPPGYEQEIAKKNQVYERIFIKMQDMKFGESNDSDSEEEE